MNKSFYVVIVLILIVSGVYFWQTKNTSKIPDVKNVELLLSEKDTPIEVLSDVKYFEGASGYFVRPIAEGSYPAVLMIHENRGLRPETKLMAEELAKEGYMVLAVDLFGKTVETQDEARELTKAFDQARGVENMKAGIAFLRGEGASKIASLGWCFGGRQSVNVSISGEKLDATVVYYGGGMATTTDALKPIAWPVLGIFGDKDQAIPVETVKTFESSLNTLGISNEIYIYEGVGHAFANPSGMNYAPEETKDAWVKTVTFLEKNLK